MDFEMKMNYGFMIVPTMIIIIRRMNKYNKSCLKIVIFLIRS
jgi:hypothetical protein